MTLDTWKTTEPDREPAPGEHRPYAAHCTCDECQAEYDPPPDECPNCQGTGYSHHNCGEDCCSCADPEDNVPCDWCTP